MEMIPRRKRIRISDNTIRFLAFVLILSVFAIINPTVLSLINICSILNNAAFIGTMTMGLMVVMITGNLDLSLVSIGLISAHSTIMIYMKLGIEQGGTYLMFFIAGLIGTLCGMLNGYLTRRFDIPGIVVSLGMAQIYNTLTIVLSGVSYIPTLPAGMRAFSRKLVLDVPTALGNATISVGAVMFAGSIILVWLLLNKTMIGRGIYALGGDKVAAARVGFNIPLVYSTAYGVMGLLCGISGMMYYANNTLFQSDWILAEQADATAGAIFGGVIMKDGKGTVGGVVLGIFLIGLIRNNLYLIGVPSYAQKLVVGVIILLSVAFSSINQFKETRKLR